MLHRDFLLVSVFEIASHGCGHLPTTFPFAYKRESYKFSIDPHIALKNKIKVRDHFKPTAKASVPTTPTLALDPRSVQTTGLAPSSIRQNTCRLYPAYPKEIPPQKSPKYKS